METKPATVIATLKNGAEVVGVDPDGYCRVIYRLEGESVASASFSTTVATAQLGQSELRRPTAAILIDEGMVDAENAKKLEPYRRKA